MGNTLCPITKRKSGAIPSTGTIDMAVILPATSSMMDVTCNNKAVTTGDGNKAEEGEEAVKGGNANKAEKAEETEEAVKGSNANKEDEMPTVVPEMPNEKVESEKPERTHMKHTPFEATPVEEVQTEEKIHEEPVVQSSKATDEEKTKEEKLEVSDLSNVNPIDGQNPEELEEQSVYHECKKEEEKKDTSTISKTPQDSSPAVDEVIHRPSYDPLPRWKSNDEDKSNDNQNDNHDIDQVTLLDAEDESLMDAILS